MTFDITPYLVFLVALPIGISAILRGKFYIALFAVVIAMIDLIFLTLKILA